MSQKPTLYRKDTIQHVCGVKEPSEAIQREGVDEGFDKFFASNGRRKPRISSYFVNLTVEQDKMINEYDDGVFQDHI